MQYRNGWLKKTLALGLFVLFLAGPVFAASTVTPADKMGEEWWSQRHAGVLEQVKDGNVDLILLGDSINHGWEGEGKEVFGKYYGHRNAVNMGYSGDRTEHVLWRLENGEIDGISPKVASLMIGTNNYGDNTAEEIGAGIIAIVNRLREKLPDTKVLILAIFPRGEKPGEVRDTLAKASTIAAGIADGNMIHYLDIGPAFLTEDGTLPKDIMPDALHPNASGYALWAAAVEPKIAELMGEVVPPAGFRALFNGLDLRGWKGLVEDPKARAEMTPEELTAKQVTADERMRAHWKIEDGALVFDGGGDSLCTDRDYADFEMLVDWKILEKGDSGVYLRGTPQVQIWDTAQWPEGSGGLYNNQNNPSKPIKCADKPIKEWNTFRIKMVGDKVSVHLNGELVVDNVTLENYWERDKPIYPTGQIELQNHGNTLWFKNVFIKEL